MLYLIKQESKNNTYYKIGYAKDVYERLKAYKNHNAEFELIDTFEGTIQNENVIHECLKEYKLPDRNEWFYYNQDVLRIWNMYKNFYSELEEVYRDKITKLEKENKNLNRKIAERDSVIVKYSDIVNRCLKQIENSE